MKPRVSSWVPWPELKGQPGAAGRVLNRWPGTDGERQPGGPQRGAEGPALQQPGSPGLPQQPERPRSRREERPGAMPQPWGAHPKTPGLSLQQQQEELYMWLHGKRLRQQPRAEDSANLPGLGQPREGLYSGLQGTSLEQEELYRWLREGSQQQPGGPGSQQQPRGSVEPGQQPPGRAHSRNPELDLQQDGPYFRLQASSMQQEGPYSRLQGYSPQQQGLYRGLQGTGLSPAWASLQQQEALSARQHVGPYLENRGSGLQQRDLGYRDLSLHAYLSNERQSYLKLATDLPPRPDLSKEWSSYLTRDQLPYRELSRELPPHIETSYIKSQLRYPPLSEDWTRYPTLTRYCSPPGSVYFRSRSPHSSSVNMLTHRNGRSRSPYISGTIGRSSPRGAIRSRSLSPYPSPSRDRPLYSSQSGRHSPKGIERNRRLSSYSLKSMDISVSPKEKQAVLSSAIQVDGIPREYGMKEMVNALRDEFKQYGRVVDVEVLKDRKDNYALVFFSRQEALELALKNRKIKLFGKKVTVSPWVVLKGDRDRPVTLASTRVMYLDNVDRKISFETLQSACKRFGAILDIEIKETAGGPCCSAVVQYWEIRDAYIAAASMEGERLGNYLLRATSGKNKVSDCVWVDGLPKSLTDEKLLQHFKGCGEVSKLLFDRLRGSALILYKTTVSARQCVRSMEDRETTVGGNYVHVDYANGRAQVAFCRSMVTSGQDIGNFLFE